MNGMYQAIRQWLKGIVVFFVDAYANAQQFYFPENYPWYWKLELLSERYEPETTEFFKHTIRPGMIVFDVGANFGYYTRLFSKLVGPTGKVYAFEPDAENWEYLVKNTHHLKNVFPQHLALTDKNGTVDFYHVRKATGIHSLLPAADAEKRSVEGVTIDSFVAQERVAKVDLLKIDVEGAEPMVFAGMKELFTHKPMVVFEHTPDVADEFLEGFAQKHAIYSIGPNGTLQDRTKVTYRMGKRLCANLVLKDTK